MKSRFADPRTRHYLIAAIILLVGLTSATVIYLRAARTPDALLEFSPETSKKYLRDLELYGGTANVLAVQFQTWFTGLWHGRSLAYSVVVISTIASFGYVFFTVVLPPSHDPNEPDNRG
jgi:ABC-type dipeptide/oligopeptide/nickel transport system permease component